MPFACHQRDFCVFLLAKSVYEIASFNCQHVQYVQIVHLICLGRDYVLPYVHNLRVQHVGTVRIVRDAQREKVWQSYNNGKGDDGEL